MWSETQTWLSRRRIWSIRCWQSTRPRGSEQRRPWSTPGSARERGSPRSSTGETWWIITSSVVTILFPDKRLWTAWKNSMHEENWKAQYWRPCWCREISQVRPLQIMDDKHKRMVIKYVADFNYFNPHFIVSLNYFGGS